MTTNDGAGDAGAGDAPECDTPISPGETPPQNVPHYDEALVQLAQQIALSLRPSMMNGSMPLFQIEQFWHALREPVSALLAETALLKNKLHNLELSSERTRTSASNPEASNRSCVTARRNS